jgi:hypothetical protein
MPEKTLRQTAGSVLCGSGLIALAGVGGWYAFLLGVVSLACLFVLCGAVALLRR